LIEHPKIIKVNMYFRRTVVEHVTVTITVLFERLQFPIKISLAFTINKAQGQTFQCVGIDLPFDCFSLGRLYVGLSRTGKPEN
jgi:ATP-dependent exoDNAse (exonuclease V) alpha subunit